MAKIYNDFQPTNLLSFAKSFSRLNGQPLDKSEIWYDLTEAQAYAATEAAYVGQILAVIDTENNKVIFYGIQDTLGTLKEVGSTPMGDELSIEIVDGLIQIKGFGKEYYAYVPAVKNEETGEITEPSKYLLTEGFKAGLEPRVVSDGDKFTIAWYEPGTETVEDVAANIESVSKTVDGLDKTLNGEGGLVDQVNDLKDQVGQAADEAGSGATGLYAKIDRIDKELANKPNTEAVTKEIAAAVAGADHLRREIVADLPEVNKADPNVIYMVPTGLSEGDNKYYEWIIIDGVFEPVGSWEVDLSAYAKINDVNDALKGKVDKIEGSRLITTEEAQKLYEIEAGAQVNIIDSVSSDFIITESKELQLGTINQNKVNGLIDSLNTKVDKKTSIISNEDGTTTEVNWTLLSPEDKSKLDSIAEGAEPNYIKAVVEDFTVINGTLGINQIPISKITNLDNQLSVIQSNVSALDKIINGTTTEEGQVVQGVVAKLDDLITTVNNISNNLTNYVTVSDFNMVVGNLEEMKNNNVNIMKDIGEIKDSLSWKDI